MESASGQHDAVQQCHGDAHVHSRAEPKTAARRAMEVERLPYPGVAGRQGVRLTIYHKGNMADEALIQDRVDSLSVVVCPLWQPAQGGSVGSLVGHAASPAAVDTPSTWQMKPSSRMACTVARS